MNTPGTPYTPGPMPPPSTPNSAPSSTPRRPNTANAATQNPQTGTRFIASCNRCRRRKIKCDTGIPSCHACAESNSSCEYHDGNLNAAVPRARIISLEQHLSYLLSQQAISSGQLQNPSTDTPNEPEFRGRLVVSGIRLACAFCRKRKIKCDGTAPCAGCTKFGRPNECSILYEEASSQGRSYVSYLEDRIRKLERNEPLHQLQYMSQQPPYGSYTNQPSQYESMDTSGNGSGSIDPLLSQPQEELPKNIPSEVADGATNALQELKGLSTSTPAVLSNSATLPTAATTWSFRQTLMSFSGFQDESGPLQNMPSRDIVQPLVQHFLRCVYPEFPFLLLSDINRSVDRFNNGQPSSNEQVLVLMIMAIAASHISKNPDSVATYNAMRLFSTAAHLAVFDPDTVDGLKMNLLMVQFASLNPSKLNAWYLSGITMRACASLGLHKESTSNDMTESRSSHGGSRDGSGQSSPRIGNATLDLIGRQEDPIRTRIDMQDSKRRLFWASYIYDRAMSISTGRPCGFDDSAISVGLPTGFSGDIHHQPVLVLLQRLRAIRMTSRIYHVLHQDEGPITEDPQDAESKVRQMATELAEWSALNVSVRSQSVSLLENEVLSAKMLLYRPCALLPTRSTEALCILAASSVRYINLNTEFLRGQIPNYFSHFKISQLFTAGVAVMYSYSQPSIQEQLDSGEVLSQVQIALCNVSVGLTSLVHRWQVGFDLADKFHKLHETFIMWMTDRKVTLPEDVRDFKNHRLGKLQRPSQSGEPDWSGLMKRLMLSSDASSRPPSQLSHTPSSEHQPQLGSGNQTDVSPPTAQDITGTIGGIPRNLSYLPVNQYRSAPFTPPPGQNTYTPPPFATQPASKPTNTSYNNYLPHQPTLSPIHPQRHQSPVMPQQSHQEKQASPQHHQNDSAQQQSQQQAPQQSQQQSQQQPQQQLQQQVPAHQKHSKIQTHRPHEPALTPLQQLAATATEHRGSPARYNDRYNNN